MAGTPSTISVTGSSATTGVDDLAVITGKHPGGATSVAISTMLAVTPQRASVMGRKGRVDLTPPYWMPPSGLTLHLAGSEVLQWQDSNPLEGSDGLAYEAAALAHFVADGLEESPLHSLTETVAIIATLERARHAIVASSTLST